MAIAPPRQLTVNIHAFTYVWTCTDPYVPRDLGNHTGSRLVLPTIPVDGFAVSGEGKAGKRRHPSA